MESSVMLGSISFFYTTAHFGGSGVAHDVTW